MKLKNVMRREYRVRLVSCFLRSVIAVRKDKTSSGVIETRPLSVNPPRKLDIVDS